jgi:hypothetical protein
MALESLTVDERDGTREATTLRQPAVQRESPVFADLSGRRGRVFRVIGRALVVVLVLWLAAVGAGLAGLGTLPGVPELGGAEQSAPRESRSPVDRTPAADRAARVSSSSPRRQRAGTAPPAAGPPARAPQRREASTPRRTRGTPPATRSPRSISQTQPRQAPPAQPPGRPAEPPFTRERPSPPASPEHGPPPHSQAPAAVKDVRPEPGQGRRPQE